MKRTVEKSISYYLDNVRSLKGATFILQYKNSGRLTYTCAPPLLIDKLSFYIVGSIKEFEDYAKMMELNKLNKEAVKPVYTKKMADNGELPPVGSECMALFDSDLDEWVKVEVLSHRYNEAGIDVASCMLPEKNFILGWFVDFKPIDTRTDEEKLIDEVAKILKNTHNENLGLVKSPDLFKINAKLIIQEVNKLK